MMARHPNERIVYVSPDGDNADATVTVEAHPGGHTLIIRRYVRDKLILSKTVEVAL